MHHFLNVAITRRCSNFLEGIFEVAILIHLILHLLFQKLTPEFLNLEVGTCSDLTLVTVFVGSRFSNLLLLFDSIDSFLEGFFFVFDAILQADDTFISFLLLVLNILHEVVETVAGLQLLLLRHTLLFELLFVYLIFASEGFLQLI